MKHLRGARFFLYHLSSAGLGLVVTSLAVGAIAYHHPSLEIIKSGLPETIPPFLFGAVPSLSLAALAGLAAWIITLPFASHLSDRSRAAAGRRRVFIVASLMPLTLCPLLFFLPFRTGSGGLSLALLIVFAILTGGGAALFTAPALALGFGSPAPEGERTRQASARAGFLAVGCLSGLALVPGFWNAFPQFGPDGSFQTSFLILILVAALGLSGAFFAIREKNPSPTPPPLPGRLALARSTFSSLRVVFSSHRFRALLPVEAALFFAFWLFIACLYFTGRDLMLADQALTRTAVILFLGLIALAQPGVFFLTRRFGKRKLLIRGIIGFAAGLALLAFTGVAPQESGLRWNCATAAAQAPDGSVWIGTKRGASRFYRGGWSAVTRDQGLLDDRITSLQGDDRGVWFGTLAGASFFDGTHWTHFSQASGLVDNRVLDIIPRDGSVWFLTPVGVSCLENAQWHRYVPPLPERNGRSPLLTCFTLDGRGALWVGTTAGLARLDESGWTHYTTDHGLRDDLITSLAVAPDNTVYIGTYQGVARFSAAGHWSFLTAENGLPDNAVHVIRLTPDGSPYVATARGVYTGQGAVQRVLTRVDGLAHDRVEDIFFARNGDVWFATGNGVSVLSNNRLTSYQYSFPLVWGLLVLLLLGLPAALLVSLPLVHETEAADEYREKTGERREALCLALPLLVRGAALLAAGLLALVLFAGAGEAVENPLPVRIALATASAAAGTSAVLFHLLSGRKTGRKHPVGKA